MERSDGEGGERYQHTCHPKPQHAAASKCLVFRRDLVLTPSEACQIVVPMQSRIADGRWGRGGTRCSCTQEEKHTGVPFRGEAIHATRCCCLRSPPCPAAGERRRPARRCWSATYCSATPPSIGCSSGCWSSRWSGRRASMRRQEAQVVSNSMRCWFILQPASAGRKQLNKCALPTPACSGCLAGPGASLPCSARDTHLAAAAVPLHPGGVAGCCLVLRCCCALLLLVAWAAPSAFADRCLHLLMQ